MKIADVKKLTAKQRYLYWIREREEIRLKREADEPKPWTDDEILQSYSFCNVRRMDDRVSQWLLKNWYEPNFDHENMLVAVLLARHFNLPEALEEIGFPFEWNPGVIRVKLRKRMKEGKRCFNSAYIIKGTDGPDKIASVINYVIKPIVSHPPIIYPYSMQKTCDSLTEKYGIGSFLGGQITADLRHAMAGTWEDKYRWAPIGPGSKRGLNRLLGKPTNVPLAWDIEFPGVIEMLRDELPESIYGRLESIDCQSTLCEFDKYERVLWGQGRPKRNYPGVI